MSHSKDDNQLDAMLHRAADIGEVAFDRKKWQERLAAHPERSSPSRQETLRQARFGPHRHVWRRIMDSKITRYSAAATIVVAASLILSDPFDFFGSSHGVVWAEVAAKVAETHTLVHREKRFFYEQGQEEPFLEADVVKYVSSEHGIVEEQYDTEGNLMGCAYMLKQSQRVLFVFSPHKRYLDLPLDEAFTSLIDSVTPKGLVDYFTSRPSTPLGRSQFDGHDVEGFEIDDVSFFPIPERYRFLVPLEGLTYRLWIDVESSLPVGLEAEFTSGRGLLTWFKRLRVKVRAFDFRWDAELPEGTFEPSIPEDYSPMDPQSIAKENAAWFGVGVLPVIGVIVHRRCRRRSHRP